MSVATWLTLATGSALGGFVATVFFSLIGVMGVVTLGVLAQSIHANTGDAPPPTGA